jgi:hypothetical protein
MYSCHCGAFSVCSHHTIIICALHLPYARNAAVTLRGVVCCISAFTAVMYSSTAIVTRAYDRPVVCCRHKQPEICCFARPLQHGIMDRAILCWRASIFFALSRVEAQTPDVVKRQKQTRMDIVRSMHSARLSPTIFLLRHVSIANRRPAFVAH